jgi:hypothetical protein
VFGRNGGIVRVTPTMRIPLLRHEAKHLETPLSQLDRVVGRGSDAIALPFGLREGSARPERRSTNPRVIRTYCSAARGFFAHTATDSRVGKRCGGGVSACFQLRARVAPRRATFPFAPLNFGTVGFPRYGFKARFSVGAFPPGVRERTAPLNAGNAPPVFQTAAARSERPAMFGTDPASTMTMRACILPDRAIWPTIGGTRIGGCHEQASKSGKRRRK